jgi:hypothetical protein
MPKIVFFNHYHRGDLHTHKEFIRQIQNELPEFELEYLHNNPAKLLLDLGIPTVGDPNHLNSKEPFYAGEGVLYINTWVGCDWDIFCKHGGINMHTLCEQWENIFEGINEVFETNLKLNPSKEHYLPRIDYTKFDTKNIDDFLNYLLTCLFKQIMSVHSSVHRGFYYLSNSPIAKPTTQNLFIFSLHLKTQNISAKKLSITFSNIASKLDFKRAK